VAILRDLAILLLTKPRKPNRISCRKNALFCARIWFALRAWVDPPRAAQTNAQFKRQLAQTNAQTKGQTLGDLEESPRIT
jgi:hypothetical protein